MMHTGEHQFEQSAARNHRPVTHQLNLTTNLIVRSALQTYKKEVDVNAHEAWVLLEVGKLSPVSARTIARILSADEGQVSRSVKALEKRKIIRRTPDPENGRRQLLVLTNKGRQLYEKTMDVSNRRIAKLLTGISKKEQEHFVQTLEKIKINAEEILENRPD